MLHAVSSGQTSNINGPSWNLTILTDHSRTLEAQSDTVVKNSSTRWTNCWTMSSESPPFISGPISSHSAGISWIRTVPDRFNACDKPGNHL
ncbi:hypothetical protein RRG08_006943 [Elysia crispata]|uniref:Uncharacterized protein n=1 Tax=Elysia crispata TaxID=231223 RepID=A0AAE1CKX3_9GAST|nr:hypothetical protein RRG08_006943 [Elysia crispata]